MDAFNDATKNGIEETKKSFLERFGGPLTAYVASSWLAYNWSNIVFLFMSNSPVEKRLAVIYAQEHLYLYFFVIPILTGFFLSFAVPGLNAFITSITAKFSAISDRAKDMALKRLEIKILEQETTRLELAGDIANIEKNQLKLTTEITLLENSRREKSLLIEGYNKKILSLVLRSNKLINEYEALFLRAGVGGQVTIKLEDLNNLFTREERNEANAWRLQTLQNLNVESANALIAPDGKPVFISEEMVNKILVELIQKLNSQGIAETL